VNNPIVSEEQKQILKR